jgi:hypothetical protein
MLIRIQLENKKECVSGSRSYVNKFFEDKINVLIKNIVTFKALKPAFENFFLGPKTSF